MAVPVVALHPNDSMSKLLVRVQSSVIPTNLPDPAFLDLLRYQANIHHLAHAH